MIYPRRLEQIVIDCLYREGESTEGHVKAEGIVSTYGFHPERLEIHRDEIKTMLADLPEPFHQSTGGGWSFLNACTTRDGELWTGEQRSVEQLVCLGIALGLVEFLIDREYWEALPGGMPYFVVKDS